MLISSIVDTVRLLMITSTKINVVVSATAVVALAMVMNLVMKQVRFAFTGLKRDGKAVFAQDAVDATKRFVKGFWDDETFDHGCLQE